MALLLMSPHATDDRFKFKFKFIEYRFHSDYKLHINRPNTYQDIINNISVISNKHITLISVIFHHQI